MNNFNLSKEEAKEYLQKKDILKYLQKKDDNQIEPDYSDLARLHILATQRKSFTVLEFGIGFSTIVLADALRANEALYKKSGVVNSFRVEHPFKVFSIDSSKKWVKIVREMIPEYLRKYVDILYSPISAGTFCDRICHFYKKIPNIIPDFIYLDGPDPTTVSGSINGISWKNKEVTVMSGDILKIEPILLPRTLIVVDGRSNNVRFLKNNLQRNWNFEYFEEGDVYLLELLEDPLGKINKEKMDYCF